MLLGVLRIAVTSGIAAIAAWISYHHMVGVVARYGENGTVPYLLPLSVDGLIFVASISLIELSAHSSLPAVTSPAATNIAEPSAASAAETPATPTPPIPIPALAITPPTPATPAHHDLVLEPVDQPAVAPASEQSSGDLDSDLAAQTDPPTNNQLEPSPGHDEDQNQDEDIGDEEVDGVDLASNLAPLLAAARDARDELIHGGRTVSRDALAQRLRRNGHAIRNNRVSDLLNALRREEPSANVACPTVLS